MTGSAETTTPRSCSTSSQERIRVLHYTWIAFFMTFFVWFNLAPLATTMRESSDWLTKEHVKVLLIANVALTIPARIVVGALIDRFGARVVFTWLMITMSIPTVVFAFSDTFTQMMISRLALSGVGAGFVIGIKMVAQWFPPKYIGRAEGFYAGWGNFGSAFAAMTLPWFAITVLDDWLGLGADAWRWAMAINGVCSRSTESCTTSSCATCPRCRSCAHQEGRTDAGDFLLRPRAVSCSGRFRWSAHSASWRGGCRTSKVDGDVVLSDRSLYIIYAFLTLVYVGHVVRTLQVNIPYLRAGVPEDEKYHFGSVVALNSTYFANFGAELAVVSMLPEFFETVFVPLTNSAAGRSSPQPSPASLHRRSRS